MLKPFDFEKAPQDLCAEKNLFVKDSGLMVLINQLTEVAVTGKLDRHE